MQLGGAPMTPLQFELAVFCVSVAAGMVGALLGLGGGIIVVPALALLFKIDIRYAIGASIVSVIATSSGAAAAYVRERMANLRVAMVLEVATAAGALTAEVPIPGQPLPTPFQGYGSSSPDLMVRIDVTYLRQDFSAMLPVSVENPWPESQRFDFLVRERQLSCEEADDYRAQLSLKEPGVLSPYHKAAVSALRDLTGKDAAPTAEAWRKLLAIKVRE